MYTVLQAQCLILGVIGRLALIWKIARYFHSIIRMMGVAVKCFESAHCRFTFIVGPAPVTSSRKGALRSHHFDEKKFQFWNVCSGDANFGGKQFQIYRIVTLSRS